MQLARNVTGMSHSEAMKSISITQWTRAYLERVPGNVTLRTEK